MFLDKYISLLIEQIEVHKTREGPRHLCIAGIWVNLITGILVPICCQSI